MRTSKLMPEGAGHRLEADDEVRVVVGLVERHESHALISDQLGEVILQRSRVGLPVAQRDRVLFRVEGLPCSGRPIEDDVGGFYHRRSPAGCGHWLFRLDFRQVVHVDLEKLSYFYSFGPRTSVGSHCSSDELLGDAPETSADINGFGIQPAHLPHMAIIGPARIKRVVGSDDAADILDRASLAGQDKVAYFHRLGEMPGHEGGDLRRLRGLGPLVFLEGLAVIFPGAHDAREINLTRKFTGRCADGGNFAFEFDFTSSSHDCRLRLVVNEREDGTIGDAHVMEVVGVVQRLLDGGFISLE